ncbi:hypothetical protein SERLA73DRAFT_172419 [Serpula lacrymans var. lacrymans S7.3]|uniref:UBC core domain-containing protein n=2 Tax=Serpula lacrymans var. lacrymans TaxID=341189 RepID=F8QFA8_SERL3|nr:uncharacterized protein SERLADRAFT_447124 [Serpula lacrymans var. lacrymans S7.9]EGN93067.1 hypothetical protein SERLA73DRAFT_172419 [Serpula lacrymans var. lacrymans S7.3]EGO27902.1 hypothetical protein SERLADRAFT_447124 [Serpula lacrymans var. lacrymans S7.9]
MEREIEQLVEMGATVPQARAALRRYKDVMRAAEHIFEGQFDDVTDDVEDVDDYVDYDSDYEGKSRPAVEVDPYSGIFFSKDRREEVIEVEEEPETTFLPEVTEQVKLMTQGQWMKGCPEGGEQSFLFSLYSQLSDGVCCCTQQCGYTIKRKKGDFFALFSDFPTYIGQLRSTVRRTCPTCQTVFCYACGESVDSDKNQRQSVTSDDDGLFHCSNLQGVILGVGLLMLETMFAEQRQEASAEQDQGALKSRTNKRRRVDSHSATPSGDDDDDDEPYFLATPHGKKPKGGTGYAGDQREDVSGQLEALALQRTKDEKIGVLLSEIRVYLPSLRRPGGARTSDYMVHPTALAHLRRRFNCLCTSLLRNDSLSDMSDRSVLYFELFEWLETISNHEALASMMAMPIMVASSVKSITAKKTEKGRSPVRERTIVYEGSSGPRELLEAIVIQAQAAIKGLEGAKPNEPTAHEMTEEEKRMTSDMKGKTKESTPIMSEENQKLLTFCHRILATALAIDRSLRETKGDAFVDRLHTSLPKIVHSSILDDVFVDVNDTEEFVKATYVNWATKVRFEYCDLTVPKQDVNNNNDEKHDDVPHYKFYYNNEARMLASSDIPKRSLAIAKELAVLTTNLPVAWDSSIFLRVDETRVDVIKALITGPEGTPYYNGCYLFDIFLGPNYNQSPPNVKYMTTNGGKFRFNPNLYADGKVCLSLLGTWTGPGWISGKSTLLQVLISIQSMILCEEPYLNEPGWAMNGGSPQSLAYSANVRRMVVRTAMLGNLKNPPEPFGDVIRTHFRLKARSIITQLDDWLSRDDGRGTVNDGAYNAKAEAGTSTNGFKKDVEELQLLLNQIQENKSNGEKS